MCTYKSTYFRYGKNTKYWCDTCKKEFFYIQNIRVIVLSRILLQCIHDIIIDSIEW